MNQDVRVAALLDALSAIENRLDPDVHRHAQRIADAVSLAIALPVIVLLGLSIDQPLILFALMLVAFVLNRIPPWLSRRALLREQDRLFREYSEMVDPEEIG